MRSTERNFIALLIVAVLAACGGGGGASGPANSIVPAASSAPTAAAPAAPAGYARASFSITLPKSTGAAARSRQTVGAGTQSITFTLLQSATSTTSGTPQTFALTATSPGCTTNSSGALVCTLGVNAPVGLDVFLAQTFTNTDGTGALTGSGAVQLDVALNSTNTASLSLTSQVASVFLTSSSTYLGAQVDEDSVARSAAATRRTAAAAATVPSARVFVVALDGSGNTILNPSIYDTPISLQLIYTNGYQTPVAGTVPDLNLQVTYSSSVDPGGCGGTATTSASYGSVQVCSPADVITASIINVAGGAPGAIVLGSVGATGYLPVPAPSTNPAPFPTSTPANTGFITYSLSPLTGIQITDAYNNPITTVTSLSLGTTTLPYNYVYLRENGFNGNFTEGGNCAPIANLPIANYGDGFAYVVVTTTAVGSCTATFSDGTNTVSLPITVTTTTVTGS